MLVVRDPWCFHCIIHQRALCGKALDLADVMQIVSRTVNYMRSHALKHRQFKNFLADVESEYPDLPYHCKVRWLSRGKVLKRFLELCAILLTFHDRTKETCQGTAKSGVAMEACCVGGSYLSHELFEFKTSRRKFVYL